MIRTAEHPTSWSTISGAIVVFANAGALIVLASIVLFATPAFVQGAEHTEVTVNLGQLSELKEVEQELNEVAIEVQEALGEVGIETGIKINFENDEDDARPKLGVYLNNMDFEDAYKMRYPYAHGVLVNGTVNNGSADKAGIIEDDIIMYFDGTKVLYEDHLVRLIRSKHFGDQVQVVFYRDEALDSTLVTFTKPVKKEKALALVDEDKKEKKRRNSRGYGGGGFTPMLVQDQFTDVGDLMTTLGLSSTPFKDEGIVLWGGSGQGYVGNGWFLGGFGNGGSLSNTVTVMDGTTQVDRKITFGMGFGGLTVEKRLAPFSWATIGAGVGLGGGGIDLAVSQNDGNFSWINLGTELLNTNSTTVNFSKNYAIVHPRASLMLKLTSWMRLKAEYGYLYGYSFSEGWNTTLGNSSVNIEQDSYELVGSPNTALEASTISVGLWFGF
ncbi:MAG: PDZ domain-containing protein [Candidatus Marinimicrobia bacterium]|nr:PDZ domain-containing protein [Candidatus Neomarinimicrobiota bacterium]